MNYTFNNIDAEIEKFNIVRLVRSTGITNNKIHNLLKKYNSFTEIISNISNIDKKVVLAKEDDIKKEFEQHESISAKLITYIDEEYPDLLKQSSSFPFVLSCIGNIDLLKNNKTISIIGSRNCSINSFNFSKKIAREVSSYGYTVVSGLAKGVDSASHIGSIENGTIAVLGSGLNVIYPKENQYLYYDIINKGGLIISEFSINATPKPENFIIRNRIIAGLSKGVLVIEAGLSSGTMHTVKYAIDMNRDIMIFPGNPYDDRCAGSNKLLQEGATMVIDTKDIINCLESIIPYNNLKDNEFVYNYNTENSNIEYNDDLTEIENIEDIILSKLDYIPINVGDLIDSLDYNLNIINSHLTKLQLNNKIIIEYGKVSLKFNNS